MSNFRLAVWVCIPLLAAGCLDPKMFKWPEETAEKAEQPPVHEAPRQAAPAAPAAPKFAMDNDLIVDKKKALAENPKLVETENRIDATDPLTAASQSFFTIGSRAQLMNFKHQIDILKAQNERPPTFKEFEELFQQNRVKLNGLYRWQVYAYDETTGEICILEDREMKKRLYEEQGLKAD